MSDAPEFDVTLEHLDGYVRVALRGEFDFDAVQARADALEQLSDLRRNVVLDLRDLRFCDTAGLRYLVNLSRRHEGPVRVVHAQPTVRRVFEITGLHDIFDLQD